MKIMYNTDIPNKTRQTKVKNLKKLFKKLKKVLDKQSKVWYNKGKLKDLKRFNLQVF